MTKLTGPFLLFLCVWPVINCWAGVIDKRTRGCVHHFCCYLNSLSPFQLCLALCFYEVGSESYYCCTFPTCETVYYDLLRSDMHIVTSKFQSLWLIGSLSVPWW